MSVVEYPAKRNRGRTARQKNPYGISARRSQRRKPGSGHFQHDHSQIMRVSGQTNHLQIRCCYYCNTTVMMARDTAPPSPNSRTSPDVTHEHNTDTTRKLNYAGGSSRRASQSRLKLSPVTTSPQLATQCGSQAAPWGTAITPMHHSKVALQILACSPGVK